MPDPYTAALAVARRLRAAGFEAYLAGGAVRDRLLGLKPRDWDVATNASPSEVQALFPRTEPVGAAFGVVLVVQEGLPVHVTTFREEGPYRDGRRPASVRRADLRTDARRRDFTINALYLDPETGEILDFVGGREDLEVRRLRTVGHPRERLGEDRLRLLRAARFAARFDLTVDPELAAAARELAAGVLAVAAERRTQEMELLLAGPHLPRALTLLAELGLAPHLLPGVDAAAAAGRAAGLPVPWRAARPAALGWALVLWGVPAPEAVLGRYRLPRRTREAIRDLTRLARRLLRFSRLALPRRKRLVGHPRFPAGLGLAAAATGRTLADVRTAAVQWPGAALKPPRYLTGADLLARGVPPGPAVARLLHRLEDLALAGRIRSRAEALAALAALRGAAGKE